MGPPVPRGVRRGPRRFLLVVESVGVDPSGDGGAVTLSAVDDAGFALGFLLGPCRLDDLSFREVSCWLD